MSAPSNTSAIASPPQVRGSDFLDLTADVRALVIGQALTGLSAFR